MHHPIQFNYTFIDAPGVLYEDAIRFLQTEKSIAVDTETTHVDPYLGKILLLSLGNPMRQFVFDIARLEKHLDSIKKILSDPNKLFLLHNAKFDYKFLKHCLNITLEQVYDTMIAEMLLLKGRKTQVFGLDDVVDKYMNIKLNKDIRKTFSEMHYGDKFSVEQIQYSAMDVMFLEYVKRDQEELLLKHGLKKVSDLEMAAIPPTADMELNGIYLDTDKWKLAEEAAKKQRDDARLELDILFIELVGEDMFGQANINYNSPKQLLPALKKLIGTKANDLSSTGEADLKEVNHPVIDTLLKYREAEKQVTTYGSKFLDNIHSVTGRVHSNFAQLYTDTGRYSSNSPNLQNIPALAPYRSAFTARNKDYRIIACDYSGMELRILADLSGEPSWIECFKRNGDLHAENGSVLYGKTIRRKGTLGPSDPGENENLRDFVKTLNFG